MRKNRKLPVRTLLTAVVIAVALTPTPAGALLRGDGGKYHDWVLLGIVACVAFIIWALRGRR